MAADVQIRINCLYVLIVCAVCIVDHLDIWARKMVMELSKTRKLP